MSTLKTHNLQSPDAGSVNIALTPNAGMVVAGVTTFSTSPVVPNGGYYKGVINSGSQQKIVGGYISGSDTLRLGESMYLSSTGLGIGVASPTVKLDVAGDLTLTDTTADRDAGTEYKHYRNS